MKMIPDYIGTECASQAERLLFDRIRSCTLPGSWHCFHSLTLMKHSTKRQGEADFVLVGTWGIFVLEVKGGRVARESGAWIFTDRDGHEHRKTEGPFQQAKSAMYALGNSFSEKFGEIPGRALTGYGVVFPDIEFRMGSPEWDPEMIFDARDRSKPFNVYLQRLASYWRNRTGNQSLISEEELSRIVRFLRGDFEVSIPLTEKLGEVEKSIIRFTEEQQDALDAMSENPRIVFKGNAGSGKTQLAIEQAKKYAFNGYKTLFLCFNSLLASKLRNVIQEDKLTSHVTVDSVFGFMLRTITKAPNAKEFQIQNSRSGNFDEALHCEHFQKAVQQGGEAEFDALILDEAQDFMKDEIILPLEYVLKSGFESGRWSIFLDPSNQRVFLKNFSPQLLQYFCGCNATVYNLKKNCRNSKPITLHISVVSGFPMGEALVNEGKKVVNKWFGETHELANQIVTEIRLLTKSGVRPKDITVIYPGGSGVRDVLLGVKVDPVFMELTKDNINTLPTNVVGISSVQSYKGLENNIILMADIRELDSEFVQTINYVGLSRAKCLLYLFLHMDLRGAYHKKVTQWASKETR